MGKRTREIIALVMLIVLGLLAVGAMAWYLLVGHNWNQAATHIDDMVGSMDGYTVVVYDGVVKQPNAVDKAKKPALATGSGSSTSAAAPSASSASPSAASPSAASSSAAAGVSVNTPSSKHLDAATIAQSYREKGASVVLFEQDAPALYDEPQILYRNGKRIGVFSFPGKYRLRYAKMRASIRYLQQHSVDFTIAVGKDKALLKGQLSGIDLLVLYRDAGIPESGEFIRSTFCVDSPYIGQTQAVIIAPSGVMTSRTIGEL